MKTPEGWTPVLFGNVTQRVANPVEIDPERSYREIGIRSHGKGVFHKPEVEGATLKAKRIFEVVPNCLVVNIVFAWEGAVAVTAERERRMVASHRFPMFQPTSHNLVDVGFLRRFFQTKLGVRLLGEASPGGAGRNRTLNQKFLAEIPILLPPLGEQRKIAAILSSVDEAIEATQAVIDQLGVVKKAMMAELLTRGLPGRHTRFKQTEIGEVPEEWEIVRLGDVLESIESGWSPQCESHPAPNGRWGVLKVSAVSSGEFKDYENKELPSNLIARRALEVNVNDVIISRANTPELVGRVALVRETRPLLLLSDKLLRLQPQKDRITPVFLDFVLSTPSSRSQIQDAATGSSRSMKNVSQHKLKDIRIPSPTVDEQQAISHLLNEFHSRTTLEQQQAAALRSLKSALMSVLLTGEVRVQPDPETT